jgi:hypothetical protein
VVGSRLFSDDQLEALKGFPDIDKDELIRFFTLTPADVVFVDPGRGRGPADRLGLAVQSFPVDPSAEWAPCGSCGMLSAASTTREGGAMLTDLHDSAPPTIH